MNDHISDVAIEFVQKLQNIWDDKDFIIGMLSFADNDEDRKTIIEFIDAGVDVDVETVSVLALELNDKRNGR